MYNLGFTVNPTAPTSLNIDHQSAIYYVLGFLDFGPINRTHIFLKVPLK